MPRKPRRPPARKKDGGIDRRGQRMQKAPDELATGEADQVERESKYNQVAGLMGQGLTQSEIAEKIGCTQPLVCRYMTEIRLEWRALRMDKFENVKDEVHGWALQNYRRAHKLLEKAEAAGDLGAARLCLQEARKCAEQLCKLLGLFPANQKDIDPEEAMQRLAARLSVDPSQMVM